MTGSDYLRRLADVLDARYGDDYRLDDISIETDANGEYVGAGLVKGKNEGLIFGHSEADVNERLGELV